MLRYVLCISGLILAVPILIILALAFTVPISTSGLGYLLGGAIISTGLILAPRLRQSPKLTGMGLLIIFAVASIRLVMAGTESHTIQMVTLPNGAGTRWINLLIDEQDSVIFGEALFQRVGGVSPAEHDQITAALEVDYAAMRAQQNIIPSPFLSTYLNLQQPDHFDAVIIASASEAPAAFGLIFLHGFMGNVTAQCWEIAQALQDFNAITVCPSANAIGAWWLPDGQAILRSTFAYLREQGIRKIYLGGFSNGGFGISRLMTQVTAEKGLAGLIFVDGIENGAGIRASGLPVLIIAGTQDERVPTSYVKQIVEEIGSSATYIEIESDHFIIMKQPRQVQEAITQWLEKFEAPR